VSRPEDTFLWAVLEWKSLVHFGPHDTPDMRQSGHILRPGILKPPLQPLLIGYQTAQFKACHLELQIRNLDRPILSRLSLESTATVATIWK